MDDKKNAFIPVPWEEYQRLKADSRKLIELTRKRHFESETASASAIHSHRPSTSAIQMEGQGNVQVARIYTEQPHLPLPPVSEDPIPAVAEFRNLPTNAEKIAKIDNQVERVFVDDQSHKLARNVSNPGYLVYNSAGTYTPPWWYLGPL